MKLRELTEYIREMFDGSDDEPGTVEECRFSMKEGADYDIPYDQIVCACEQLVMDGMIERIGKDTYRCTNEYLALKQEQENEALSVIFADHVIRKAAAK